MSRTLASTPTTVYSEREGDLFAAEVTLITIRCFCGIPYAIPKRLYESAQEHRGPTGWSLCCPLGHSWHYTGPTEEEKLREQLQRERDYSAQVLAERDQVQASLRAQKAATTRLKKRVNNGVCPCCNRSFQNLHRHMTVKHPGFTEESEG